MGQFIGKAIGSSGRARPGEVALALGIAGSLALFLVIPVVTVVYVAFTEKGSGALTLVNFVDFFRTDLFLTSFWNSLWVSAMTVIVATLIALPLAVLTARFEIRGSAVIETLGFLPLIMPPFAGAVAMQLLLGRNGTVNLLLEAHVGFKIPFMEGLNGVILAEAIHYFPFILINLTAALRNIDRSMEEAAQILGAGSFRLLRRVLLPLAMPGYIAGASLVFVKVFDDLATPLLLDVKLMLAPQAYLRITSVGLADPMGYVISVILIVVSVASMAVSALAMRGRDYSTLQRGGGGLARRRLKGLAAVAAYAVITVILLLVISPHVGLLVLSLATVWSFSPLPDGYTLAHYGRVLSEAGGFISNTLLYASLAGLIDVVLGVAIAYLVLRTKLIGRHWLDWTASAALAVPGVVLGIGYLRTFFGVTLPDGRSLASLWIMIVIALAVRRLPYALRSCMAALQQVSTSLEEAAQILGAGKLTTLRRVVVPLMTGGVLAGFMTSFATAAVELSATLMLVQSNSDAPLAYGLYVYMQSPAGRGPGAALGIIAVLIVAVSMLVASRIAKGEQSRRSGVREIG